MKKRGRTFLAGENTDTSEKSRYIIELGWIEDTLQQGVQDCTGHVLKYDFGGPGVLPMGDRKLRKGCKQGTEYRWVKRLVEGYNSDQEERM